MTNGYIPSHGFEPQYFTIKAKLEIPHYQGLIYKHPQKHLRITKSACLITLETDSLATILSVELLDCVHMFRLMASDIDM
jgi:hypothetical protein